MTLSYRWKRSSLKKVGTLGTLGTLGTSLGTSLIEGLARGHGAFMLIEGPARGHGAFMLIEGPARGTLYLHAGDEPARGLHVSMLIEGAHELDAFGVLKHAWRKGPLKPQRVALLKRCFASRTQSVAAERCADSIPSC